MFDLGLTVHTVGELLIAFTLLRVHYRVLHEHKIDKAVFIEMRKEQAIGIVGAICIIVGYTIQVVT